MTAARELTGLRFGKLVAIERAPRGKRIGWWRCVCDCGGEKIARAKYLTRGNTRSCGCMARELRESRHKLTPAIVISVRERRASGESVSAMAREFGVTPTCVRNAIKGRNWRSVGDELRKAS